MEPQNSSSRGPLKHLKRLAGACGEESEIFVTKQRNFRIVNDATNRMDIRGYGGFNLNTVDGCGLEQGLCLVCVVMEEVNGFILEFELLHCYLVKGCPEVTYNKVSRLMSFSRLQQQSLHSTLSQKLRCQILHS